MRLSKSLLILSVLSVNISATSKILTPQKALERWHAESQQTNKRVLSLETKDIVTTLKFESVPAAYIFSSPEGGYSVVNADSRGPALLGYGDASLADDSQIPPDMIWWIEQYAEELRSIPDDFPYSITENDNYEIIRPLCSTNWGQGAPFNQYCPKIDDKNTWTGCVALSMAQIMRKFEWPAHGDGCHSYAWNNQELSIDFEKVSFDWQNMIDSYNGNYTQQQGEAVARLCSACGISVDMNYGLSGSGAEGEDQVDAFMKYFDYGKCTTLLDRNDFYVKDWQDIIYASLNAGSPVAYMGHSSGGGHAFIIDGYGGNGYFHLNWGWSGDADGYFLLTSLNPYEELLSGFVYGYNREQKAVVFTMPSYMRDTPLIVMSCDGSLNGYCSEDNSTLGIRGVFKYFGNDHTITNVGLLIANSNEESEIYPAGVREFEALGSIDDISIPMPKLEDGSYSITPVYYNGNEWKHFSAKANKSNRVNLCIKGDKYVFETETHASLELKRMEFNTPFYQGRPFEISFDIHNPCHHEQSLQFHVAFLNKDNDIIWNFNPETVWIEGNQTISLEYQECLPFFSGRDFSIVLAYKENDEIKYLGEPKPMNLEYSPSGYSFEGTGMDAIFSADIDPQLTINYGIRSIEGYYCFKPRIAIIDSNGNIVLRKMLGKYDFVLNGETGEFSRTIKNLNLDDGIYTIRLYASVSAFSDETSDDEYMPFLGETIFSIRDSSVSLLDSATEEEFAGNNEPASCLYNMQGMRISSYDLKPGLYVIKNNGKTQKILVK